MNNLHNIKQTSVIAGALLGLAACSSGGGGSSSTTAAISSWPDPFASQQVSASGISQEGTYYDSGNPNTTMSAPATGASMTLKMASDGSVESLLLKPQNAGQVNQDSNSTNTDLINASTKVDMLTDSSGQNVVLLANPVDKQWEYQTYASWITGLTTASGKMGAMSVGWTTDASSVPSTGTATYSGTASGIYQSGGAFYYTHADMSALVDFSQRTLGFSTVSTRKYGDITNTSSSSTITTEPNLNLSGNLTWNSGSNQFSGALTNSGSSLNGTATGYFYGTNAEEIGGSFNLTNGSSTVYQGAFGGQK